MSGRLARLTVEVDGVASDVRRVALAPTAPALFANAGLAAALNEDGSVNGPLNPAAPGSVIVLFGTGAGVTDPPSVDGEITGATLPRPIEPVEVTFGEQPAEILYAGAAPGLVAGVIQINARISGDQAAADAGCDASQNRPAVEHRSNRHRGDW